VIFSALLLTVSSLIEPTAGFNLQLPILMITSLSLANSAADEMANLESSVDGSRYADLSKEDNPWDKDSLSAEFRLFKN
jgi:hypothetical protein